MLGPGDLDVVPEDRLEDLADARAAASFFDLDLADAVMAGKGDECPRCTRHCAEYRIMVFVPGTTTPEKSF